MTGLLFIFMQEIWKDIEGYEGLYQISNLGNVKSLTRRVKQIRNNKVRYYIKPGRLMALPPNDQKYVHVSLYKNGIEKQCKVHRLVAFAFIDNPSGHPEVNHKDFNKENNAVNNLEWVEHDVNMKYNSKRKNFI